MGSQTSTTRQHAFNDTYRSGIPGIGPLQTGDGAPDESSLNYGHPSNDGVLDDSFPGSSRGDLQVYGRAGAEPKPPGEDNDLIPCVFTWTHGGHVVYLTGSFNNWSVENKFRLNRSGHEFSYIQNLRRGVHYYKFIVLGLSSLSESSVDDQWRYAPDQQTQTDEHGNINNVLDISGFRHLQFKTVSESEQARDAHYHQCVPEPSDYAADAQPIPTLLAKWPQISCVASTQRWRIENSRPTTGQRYATYIYLTVNPLYPLTGGAESGEGEEESHLSPACAESLNPLRDLLVLPGSASPRFSGNTERPVNIKGSPDVEDQPKRQEDPDSPGGVKPKAGAAQEAEHDDALAGGRLPPTAEPEQISATP